MKNLFFELLKVAVGHQSAFYSLSRVPSAEEWTGLYQMAKEHALIGVCFAAIQKLPNEQLSQLPFQLKMHWLAMVVQIQKRNELMNQRCVELQKRLVQDDFRTYIMKGQGNTILYGDKLCSLRQSGDIDIYLEGGYKKVIDYVNRTFPTKDVNEYRFPKRKSI